MTVEVSRISKLGIDLPSELTTCPSKTPTPFSRTSIGLLASAPLLKGTFGTSHRCIPQSVELTLMVRNPLADTERIVALPIASVFTESRSSRSGATSEERATSRKAMTPGQTLTSGTTDHSLELDAPARFLRSPIEVRGTHSLQTIRPIEFLVNWQQRVLRELNGQYGSLGTELRHRQLLALPVLDQPTGY